MFLTFFDCCFLFLTALALGGRDLLKKHVRCVSVCFENVGCRFLDVFRWALVSSQKSECALCWSLCAYIDTLKIWQKKKNSLWGAGIFDLHCAVGAWVFLFTKLLAS